MAGAGMSSIASQRSVTKPRSGLGQGAMPTAQLPITTVCATDDAPSQIQASGTLGGRGGLFLRTVTPLSADGVTIGSHMTWAS